jgi:hypothetical protein
VAYNFQTGNNKIKLLFLPSYAESPEENLYFSIIPAMEENSSYFNLSQKKAHWLLAEMELTTRLLIRMNKF